MEAQNRKFETVFEEESFKLWTAYIKSNNKPLERFDFDLMINFGEKFGFLDKPFFLVLFSNPKDLERFDFDKMEIDLFTSQKVSLKSFWDAEMIFVNGRLALSEMVDCFKEKRDVRKFADPLKLDLLRVSERIFENHLNSSKIARGGLAEEMRCKRMIMHNLLRKIVNYLGL